MAIKLENEKKIKEEIQKHILINEELQNFIKNNNINRNKKCKWEKENCSKIKQKIKILNYIIL